MTIEFDSVASAIEKEMEKITSNVYAGATTKELAAKQYIVLLQAINKYGFRILGTFRNESYCFDMAFNKPIYFNGGMYRNTFDAYAAMGCADKQMRMKFSNLYRDSAIKLLKNTQLRSDWEEIRDQVMYEATLCKFQQNNGIGNTLRKTKGVFICYGNDTGDTHWGISNGYGYNRLGFILMRVRAYLLTGDSSKYI